MSDIQWVTVKTAAEALKLTPQRVRALARDGTLRARKPGRDWQVDPDSVRDYGTGRNKKQ